MTLMFRVFTPPNKSGPEVVVASEDIVAVEQAHYLESGVPGARSYWRALLHLRGGSKILVDQSWESVVRAVYNKEQRQLHVVV